MGNMESWHCLMLTLRNDQTSTTEHDASLLTINDPQPPVFYLVYFPLTFLCSICTSRSIKSTLKIFTPFMVNNEQREENQDISTQEN